jgi:hypothetical protein
MSMFALTKKGIFPHSAHSMDVCRVTHCVEKAAPATFDYSQSNYRLNMGGQSRPVGRIMKVHALSVRAMAQIN